MTRIEKGKKPRKVREKGSKFNFDRMKPGDSFVYDGSRSVAIIAYGNWATVGTYRTESEHVVDENGYIVKEQWRFYMIEDPFEAGQQKRKGK